MAALKGLLVEVNRRNVFLEGRMFSEGLIAWWIFGTAILVSPIMCSEMAPKPRASHEALVATWTVTDIVSYR